MKRNSSLLLKGALAASLLTLAACADLTVGRAAYQVQDYEAARKNLEDLSNRGFPEADTKLGEMYTSGNGVPVDTKKAIALFNKADAQESYPPAIIDIGESYRLGVGVPKNTAKAKECYDRALALGDLSAYIQLGLLQQDAKHYAVADDFFNKAAASDPGAWKYLGDLRLLQHKQAQAEEYYNKGIAGGDISAYMNLGHLHMDQGKYAQAETDFEKSAGMGNTEALLSLGDAQIALGKFDEAEQSYDTALKAGDKRADIKIGNMYRNGNGRPVDGAQALYWYYKARKDGVPGMDERIMHEERKLQPEEIARALKLSAGKSK